MQTKPNWEIIAKYIQNECTDTEKADFENWLSLDIENMEYFNKVLEAWDSYEDDHASSYNPDKIKGWNTINNRINSPNQKVRKLNPWAIRIAASLVLLIGLTFLIKTFVPKIQSDSLIVASLTKNEEPKKIILSDGTLIWLNSASTIEYSEKFTSNERIVKLIGEAYFEVARDTNRPFKIMTNEIVTEVLGTSFNLRAYSEDEEIKITVNSGRVAFYNTKLSSQKLILTKGKTGCYDYKHNKLIESEVGDINYTSWKTGKLLFNNSSLDMVCQTLEKHYHKQITIKDDTLKNLSLTASYSQQSFTEVIDILSETLDINYEISGDNIVLSTK